VNAPARAVIAICGASEPTDEQYEHARAVGAGLARAGAVVVCGGRGGVMEAAARGAAEAGGTSLGILPGASRDEANEHVTFAVATGMGELRNGLIVRTADAVIAIGGGYGTLSEIALALRIGRPVIALGSWELGLDDITRAADPDEAVRLALGSCAKS
jgi:uncharacterized protein (TIGR00725 family)